MRGRAADSVCGNFLGAMALLLRPLWRRQILQQSADAPPKSKFWYFVNRFANGVGSFLIFLAISRASPAMVSAIADVRYAVIFVGVYLITQVRPDWLQEDFRRRVLIGKSIATGLIVAGLVLVGLEGNESGSSAAVRPRGFWHAQVMAVAHGPSHRTAGATIALNPNPTP